MPTAKRKFHLLRRQLVQSQSGGSLADKAYKTLHLAIQDNELTPGTRLRELELTECFGISRTPIREALKRLQNEGLVANDPEEGLIVAKLDVRMLSELYEIREVLEGTAAAFAARHASEGEIAVLRELVRKGYEHSHDPEQLVANNRAFHEALYRSAHNRYLQKTLSGFRESMSLHVSATLSVEGRSKESLDQHAAIVASIEQRDAAAAENAARAHIRQAYRLRLGLLTQLGTDI